MDSEKDRPFPRNIRTTVKPRATYAAANVLLLLLTVLSAGCSTRKNTAGTRFYHAMTTRYNVYHNGQEAYRAGLEEQRKGNHDNYMELLPLYPEGNKETTALGGSQFDRAIEKAQKAIRRHSIKRKPRRTPGKAYTSQYRQWLQRKEFNPFLHRAWMLLGKAQYQKGDYEDAAGTFAYIARLYDGQPDIVSEALIRLSRCYAALGWQYDAEDALKRIPADSLSRQLTTEYASSAGATMLTGKRYREAIPYIERTARDERDKHLKARHYYLLGQLYQQTEQPGMAYAAFDKVIQLNPPYELSLNARIRQSEVMPPSETDKALRRLQRLAKEEKNKDYLTQIYYAAGNVHLARQDTARALEAYRNGAAKSSNNGVEKSILLLAMGDLYWQKGMFPEAQQAYAEAIGLLDKEHKAYGTTMKRSEALDQIVPHIKTIQLQDSLQHLASLTEAERQTVIEGIIGELKAREEAERKAQEEAELEARKQEAMGRATILTPPSRATQPNANTNLGSSIGRANQKQAWYFYNPQLVEQGKAEFIRTWGNRKLEDNWRRRNKTVVSLDAPNETDDDEGSGLATDSIPAPQSQESGSVTTGQQPASEETDTATDDPHLPEYYLKQIPLTEEAMAESNVLLAEALLQAGVMYKELLQDFPRSEATLQRLVTQFPDYAKADEAYYHLFLTELAIDYYQKKGGMADRRTPTALQRAEEYRKTIVSRFSESHYARIVSDPDYVANAMYGRQREDSLYVRAYSAYRQGDQAALKEAVRISAERYPQGRHRAKFLFLEAASQLYEGKQKAFLETLESLVRQYPENEITDIAARVLKGVQEGRLLTGNAPSFGNIWQRRGNGAATDSIQANDSTARTAAGAFSTARDVPFLFILAYEEGKADENALLYEVARYNFSTFLVKNFDLAFTHERGIGMLQVSPFANYDEARQYQNRLYANPHMAERLEGMRALLISEDNYRLLMQQYSFDDYDAFYREHFAPIPPSELKGYTLDEPLQNLPEENEEEEEGDMQENEPAYEDIPENGVIFED